MPRPNIVIFFTDDQRFDTIAALGHPQVQTPNIDRLVARGTTFTHAHIPGGTCGAICMPSRAMLHTGVDLFRLEKSGSTIPAHHTLMGEHLKAAGYSCFGTGKWHNGTDAFNRSFNAGDNIFYGGMTDHWNVPCHTYQPDGVYAPEVSYPRCKDPFTSKEVEWVSHPRIAHGVHSSQLVCDAALDFISQQDGSQPFFSYISFLAPHDPRVMPEPFAGMYDPDTIELPPNFCGGHAIQNGALNIRDEMLAPFPRTPEVVREHIADYYGMISHLDHELGRVLDALTDQGLIDDTLIVFAGDNGLAVGQHGLFGKQSLYEHSSRVPLIFAGPGIPQGKRTDAFAYLLDIFPTLCELTEQPIPDSVCGRSLLPAISGDDRGRDELYLAYERFQRGIRTRQYKLIEYAVEGKHRGSQLFDLTADPHELANLAADPAHAATVADLRERLIAHSHSSNDRATDWGQAFWAVMDPIIG